MATRYTRVQDRREARSEERRQEGEETSEDTLLAQSFEPMSDADEDDGDDDDDQATRPTTDRRVQRQQQHGTDGVFANITAKEEPDEKLEEHPPSYEAAAADSAPPYWETTIIAPAGLMDEGVLVDGLPVGNFFAFVWNLLISMAFQFVGFLLTYLLHTTHAAKNGSRAGLGVTLIQYGFYLRAPTPSLPPPTTPTEGGNDDDAQGVWFAYVLMIAGWFLLTKSVVDFVRARRLEQVILSTPSEGLAPSEEQEPERAV